MRATITVSLVFCSAVCQAQGLLGGIRIERPAVDIPKISQMPDPPVANLPRPDNSVFGQGYDAVTGKLLPKTCVTVGPTKPLVPGAPASVGEQVFHEAMSLEQIRSDSKIKAGASLFYEGFSGTLGGSITEGSFSSSYTRYLTAYQDVIAEEFQVTSPRADGGFVLTKSAEADFDLGPRTFKASCGDHFVSGYRLEECSTSSPP